MPITQLYESFVNNPFVRPIFSVEAIEPGYLFLNYLLVWPPFIPLIPGSPWSSSLLQKLLPILRESPYISVAFLVYFCTMLADIFFVRQSIAISFCFLALWLSYKGHPRWSYCLVLAAVTIHISAAHFCPTAIVSRSNKLPRARSNRGDRCL